MALKEGISDREYNKFEEIPAGSGVHVVRTVPFGPFQVPVLADAITASYPDTVTEVYEYRQGGIAGTVLQTVTVVYTNASKSFIDNVVIT